MDISLIPAVSTSTTTSSKSSSSTGVSLTDFYKLLAAEMQYSSSLGDSSSSGGSSSDSSSYITNLLTMTQISTMQAQTKVANYSMATSMVGKEVSFNIATTNATGKTTSNTAVNGKVEAVDLSSDTPKVFVTTTVNGEAYGKWINYSDIDTVYDSNDTNASLAMSMVGKTVDYDSTSTDSSGNSVTTTVKGEIQKVDISGDSPKVYVVTTGSDGKTSGAWINYIDIKTAYSSDAT